MYTLFLDTHGSIINVSLIKGEKVITKEKESFQSHSIFFLPMIKEILDEEKISIKKIKKIIIINGPGSFTGIRIGISVAKVMGYSLNIPIYPISSLTAFLVSSDINDDKMCVIEDNKGYYISVLDRDNNSIVKETYVENLSSFKYKIVENTLNILKIVEYSKNIQSVNIHELKANYIKKIEVENDKRNTYWWI